MLKKISDLSDVMREKKILCCEVNGFNYSNEFGLTEKFAVKLTLEPSSLYQQEDMLPAKPKEEFIHSDDYDEFLFRKKELNEAKIKAEIENM